MNTAMPVGVEDFAEIRGNYYWVDKTAVISAFLQDHKKVTLFTRPRRFGKTLMMSMLRYFFDMGKSASGMMATVLPVMRFTIHGLW